MITSTLQEVMATLYDSMNRPIIIKLRGKANNSHLHLGSQAELELQWTNNERTANACVSRMA
eukprot:1877152-Pleurochrysis_carterae.AAC.11